MDSNALMQYAGLTIIAIVISKYIINWWFQIDRRIKMQKMQNNLLIEICKKQGVPPERVLEIINEYNDVKKG